jgi:hypothetical protein
MTAIGGVRVEVEKDQQASSTRWVLKAYWTPLGLAERQLILDTSASGWEISYKRGAVDAMLRHAYEQGRADASQLGKKTPRTTACER